MKQNNLFLLGLALLSFAACTGQKTPKSLATAWQKQHLQESDSLIRAVASSNNQASMCLSSVFNSTTLKNEVAEYERRFSGNPVRGSWKHLDLSTLPIPQANFLSKYGREIGDLADPESIDYSGCYDLPCIFNRIYQKESDYIAGYVHYLWYLKFGHYLSLDNKVPDQKSPTPGVYNNKQFTVLDYLYDEKELYGLWRITHLLVEPYISLTNTREIQRIPRKENLEGYPMGVCGLASSAGHIRLQDGCLQVHNVNQDRGFLYLGVIHEMTHMVDYLQAQQRKNGGWYRSHEQDYLDIVGFYKVEYTDANGKLVSEWKLKEGAKTIRSYAATSPVENFADTLAYFRQEGEETKSKIDARQYSWISSNYFHGESYDKVGNRTRLLKKYESAFTSQILPKVMDCSSTKNAYQSNYFSASDFPGATLTPWMLKCLSSEAETMANTITARVKTYEADGCASLVFREDQLAWSDAVRDSLRRSFGVYVQEIANDPEYLEKVKDFNNTLKDPFMANEAIFQCYKGSTKDNLKPCYDTKVVEIAKRAALDLKLPDDQATEMSELYLRSHTYTEVTEKLYLSYRTIISAHDELIRVESEDVWQQCLNMPHNDDEKHSGSIYTPRNGYLVSSFFNCLNAQLPMTLQDLVRSLEYEGQRITHPVEELIVLEFLEPRVVEVIREFHKEAAEFEKEQLGSHFEEISGSIKDFLLSDFGWVKSLTDRAAMMMSCRMEALGQIDFLPLYHLKRDAFSELVMQGPCRDIMSDPAFLKFLESSKEKVDREVFSKVEMTLTKKAEERALYCKEIIPWKWERTRVTVRLPRKGCMSLGWEDVERAVIEELLKDPLSQRFKISESDFRSKISEVRDAVREKVEEKHF